MMKLFVFLISAATLLLSLSLVLPEQAQSDSMTIQKSGRYSFLLMLILGYGTVFWLINTHTPLHIVKGSSLYLNWSSASYVLPVILLLVSVATGDICIFIGKERVRKLRDTKQPGNINNTSNMLRALNQELIITTLCLPILIWMVVFGVHLVSL